MLIGAAILCILAAAVEGGPYTKKGRPVASTPLVAEGQWWLQERLLAVEMRVLEASKDVGRLAEETTREAHRMTDEAQARVEALMRSVTLEARRIRPLSPQCANNAEVRRVVDQLHNVTQKVLGCTHKVSDDAAGYEVSVTVQMNDARGQVWDVQEAMYYCEKFNSEADAECIKRLMVEGLQVVSRLPDRVRHVLDGALASRAEAQDRLRGCFARGMSEAGERHLSHTQLMRHCEEELRRSRSPGPGKRRG